MFVPVFYFLWRSSVNILRAFSFSFFDGEPFDSGRDKRPVKSLVVGRPILLALEDIDGGPSFLEKALRFLEKYGKCFFFFIFLSVAGSNPFWWDCAAILISIAEFILYWFPTSFAVLYLSTIWPDLALYSELRSRLLLYLNLCPAKRALSSTTAPGLRSPKTQSLVPCGPTPTPLTLIYQTMKTIALRSWNLEETIYPLFVDVTNSAWSV